MSDEEQKRRLAGLCCYNILGLCSTAAFICAIYSYAFCDFAKRYVVLTEGTDPNTVCSEAGFDGGLESVCELLINTHGVGFEGFWATVPVNQQVCFSYTQPTPWGMVTPPMDTKFNSARALSITGIVLGGAAWFTLMLASCCKLDQAKLRGMSCYFFLATLFQGLSLLLFRSNVCQAGFFTSYFVDPTGNGATTAPGESASFVQSVTCGLSTGSNLAIAATVLWFVCNSIVPAAVVPDPFWSGGDGQQRSSPGGEPSATTEEAQASS